MISDFEEILCEIANSLFKINHLATVVRIYGTHDNLSRHASVKEKGSPTRNRIL